MNLRILIVSFLLIFCGANCQNTINESILQNCNTADKLSYLTEDEKKVILYINLARNYPDVFLENIAKPYIQSSDHKPDDFYTKSLLKELKRAKPVGYLYVDEKLYTIARDFAQKQGQTGQTGHNIREKYLDGENLSFGNETPIEIVMELLIDYGISSLGHRRNILDPSYHFIAVSIGNHKRYSTICVIDFKR